MKNSALILVLTIPCSIASANWMDYLYPSYAIPWGEAYQSTFDKSSGDYSFRFENDMFYLTDNNYTNGINGQFSNEAKSYYYDDSNGFRKLECSENADGTINIDNCLNIDDVKIDNIRSLQVGVIFGQNMYTAQDISITPDRAGEYTRPYGGWLYTGVTATSSSRYTTDVFSATIGCTGPCSLGEEAQQWAHDNLSPSSKDPQGWDTQGPTRVHFQTSRSIYQHYYPTRLIQFSPYLRYEIGTIFNRAGIGGTFAISNDGGNCTASILPRDPASGLKNDLKDKFAGLPTDYINPIPAVVMPGLSHLQPEGFNNSQDRRVSAPESCGKRHKQFYSFIDINAQGVLSNAMIEEGVHGDDSVINFDAAPFITTTEVGMGYYYNDILYSFSVKNRSQEVDGTGYNWDHHTWLQATISVPTVSLWEGFGWSFGGLLATGSGVLRHLEENKH